MHSLILFVLIAGISGISSRGRSLPPLNPQSRSGSLCVGFVAGAGSDLRCFSAFAPSAKNKSHRRGRRSSGIGKAIAIPSDVAPSKLSANCGRGRCSLAANARDDADDIDRYSDTFGPLLPLAEAVDSATGGWGLSYADLRPATPRTTVGRAFLATNIFYAAAGIALALRGELLMGGLTEVAGIVSFWYHYSQLEFGKDRSEVRLALLVDYFTAGAALITGLVYIAQAGIGSTPLEAVAAGGGAVACLGLCWVWEFGYPYIFLHSLWHILSAATGYLIGQEHIANMSGG